jgi:hypothetical protein
MGIDPSTEMLTHLLIKAPNKEKFDLMSEKIAQQSPVQLSHGFMCIILSWPRPPLIIKVKEEIGIVGGSGRPTTMTLHFPFLNLSYLISFPCI